MAARHNEYSRLLGTVENNIVSLKEQVNIPPSGVPDLNEMADACEGMASQLQDHSGHLRTMADLQPSWGELAGQQEDIGLPISGY